MTEFPTGPWWVVTAASAPSVAGGLWVFWRWWIERGDRLHETLANREQIVLRDLEAQRLSLSRDQAELFERLRNELARIQLRLLEVERDRDRGWDLARWWNQRAHELRHAGLNAQTIVVGLCAREEVAPPIWPDMELPGLEEPK
ncbi:MAG: hypothetical protein RQ966_09425 [Acetobacteraceae bacterium]|nr:hypothetical protein [Acetobacteraceae bacterium]